VLLLMALQVNQSQVIELVCTTTFTCLHVVNMYFFLSGFLQVYQWLVADWTNSFLQVEEFLFHSFA